MSTEGITAFVTAAYAVRWILAVCAVIFTLALLGAANYRADKAEERAAAARAKASELRELLELVNRGEMHAWEAVLLADTAGDPS